MLDKSILNFALWVPLDSQNRVLLQRKDKGHLRWPDYWCTFGGEMEGEEIPLDTLIRELHEETRLELNNPKKYASQTFEE